MILSGLPNQSSAPLSTKLLHFAIRCRSLLFCSCATDIVLNSWSRMSSSGRVGRHREASFNNSQNSFTMFSNLEKLLDSISIDDICACCSTSICTSRYKRFHTLVLCLETINSPWHSKAEQFFYLSDDLSQALIFFILYTCMVTNRSAN
jgi:hypothetical protein